MGRKPSEKTIYAQKKYEKERESIKKITESLKEDLHTLISRYILIHTLGDIEDKVHPQRMCHIVLTILLNETRDILEWSEQGIDLENFK